MLLPLRQDDDIVDGPLVVAVPRVQGLPPAEAGGGGLRRQRKLVMDEAAGTRRGRGGLVSYGWLCYWLNTVVFNQYTRLSLTLQHKS